MKQEPSKHGQRVQQLFNELITLNPNERSLRLEQLEQTDPELHSEIRRLLQSDAANNTTSLPQADQTLKQLNQTEQPVIGHQVGPFELLSEIGSGGMGTVFLAQRTIKGVSQQVAIKFARTAILDKNTRERFVKEQQILSKLEHPAIARLIDVGTTEQDLPYYVMEYVTGLPIDVYCEKHDLNTEQITELFSQTCEAVSYAHRHLVIHRDLKPANILVNEQGQVKLLDFGIAKQMSLNSEQATETQTLGLFLSPQYASPEQFSGKAIGFTSDVYSLGLIFYQLISKQLPYVLKGMSFSEMEQTIAQTTPAPLNNKKKHPELNTICLHCLNKEPEQRYRSVDELLADLHRYQNHQPITAKKASFAYRAKKFIRRNRVATVFSSLLAMSLSAFIGITLWQSNQIRIERDNALNQSAISKSTRDFIADMLASANPDNFNGQELTLKDVLKSSSDKIDSSFEDKPEIKIDLLNVIITAHFNLGNNELGKSLLEKQIHLIHNTHGNESLEMAKALTLLAYQYSNEEKVKEGKETILKAIRAFKESGNELDHHNSLAHSHLIQFERYLGNFEKAKEIGSRLINLQYQIYGGDHLEIANTYTKIGSIFSLQKKYPEAEENLNKAKEILQKLNYQNRHANVAILHTLGRCQLAMGKHEAAKKTYQEQLEITLKLQDTDHPDLGVAFRNLATAHGKLGELSQAEIYFKRSIDLLERMTGTKSGNTGSSYFNYGIFLKESRDFNKAESTFEKAYSILKSSLGTDHHRTIDALAHLSEVLIHKKNYTEAEKNVLAIINSQPKSPIAIANAQSLLGVIKMQLGDKEKAEKLLLNAYNLSIQSGNTPETEANKIVQRVIKYYKSIENKEKVRSYLEEHPKITLCPGDILCI